MAEKTTSVRAKISIDGADEAKQDLKKIQQAAEDFGEEGARAATGLTNTFRNIEAAYDRVETKLAAGKNITNRDVGAMGFAYAELQRQIESLFGALDRAPAEIQEAFAKATTQVNHTKERVREFKDTQQEFNTELAEGGEQWTGMSDAINKALGPMGKAQAQAMLIGAAFSEGYRLGKQFNDFIGTDTKLWDEALARFGGKLKLLIADLADGVVAFGGLLKDVFTGNFSEVGRDIDDLKEAVKKYAADGSDALTKYGAEWDRLHPKMQQAATATRDVSAANADASKTSEDLAKKVTSVHDATSKVKDKNKEIADQIHGPDYWAKQAATASGELKEVYEKLAESAQKQLAAAGEAAAAGLQKITYVSLSTVLDQVHQLQVALQQIVAQCDAAKAAMDRLAGSGGSDSGDGIDHRKAGPETISFTPSGEPSMRSSGYGVTKP